MRNIYLSSHTCKFLQRRRSIEECEIICKEDHQTWNIGGHQIPKDELAYFTKQNIQKYWVSCIGKSSLANQIPSYLFMLDFFLFALSSLAQILNSVFYNVFTANVTMTGTCSNNVTWLRRRSNMNNKRLSINQE